MGKKVMLHRFGAKIQTFGSLVLETGDSPMKAAFPVKFEAAENYFTDSPSEK
jgi:hypothetical protein